MAPVKSGVVVAYLAFLHVSQAFMIPSTISLPGVTLDSLRRPKGFSSPPSEHSISHLPNHHAEGSSHRSHSVGDFFKALPIPDDMLEKMKNLHLGVSNPLPFSMPEGHEVNDLIESIKLDAHLDAEAVEHKIQEIYSDLSSKFHSHFSVKSHPTEETEEQQDDAALHTAPKQDGLMRVFSIYHNGRLVKVFTIHKLPEDTPSDHHKHHGACVHRFAHSLAHKIRHVVYSVCSALRSFITGFLIPVLVGVAAGMTASLLGMCVGTLLGWIWVKLVDRRKRVMLVNDEEDAVVVLTEAGSGLGEKDTLLEVPQDQSGEEAPPVYVEKE